MALRKIYETEIGAQPLGDRIESHFTGIFRPGRRHSMRLPPGVEKRHTERKSLALFKKGDRLRSMAVGNSRQKIA
ncbi:MAG: hypothetical protein PHV34_03540 [Verrucomicrobiae bacterium]|nr:hypothetical protein [Verrucomicrobiae bacterium]